METINRRHLAGNIISELATANSAAVARALDLPADEIRQWEIEALFGLNTALDAMVLGFQRRMAAGAAIEPGPYHIAEEMSLGEAEGEYGASNFEHIGLSVSRDAN